MTGPADITADQLLDTFTAPPPPTQRTRTRPDPAPPSPRRAAAPKARASSPRRSRSAQSTTKPKQPARPRGSRRAKSTGRASYGIRLGAELYQALRARSAETKQSYPALLGAAYNSHWEEIIGAPSHAADNVFGAAPPLRANLGPGARMVQFCLTDPQADLLGQIAAHSRQTFPSAIRDLLTRFLITEA